MPQLSRHTKEHPSLPGRGCPVMFAFDAGGSVQPIHCGRWNCPTCEKLNARKWAKRTWNGCQEIGRPMWFWTLTMPGKIRTPAFAYKALPAMWDSVRKLMQRQQYGAWLYIAFVQGQPQRSFMPHFHVITPDNPRKKGGKLWRFKDFAVHYGFGHQAECDPVNSEGAAWYVSRYASRGDPHMPKSFRRVRAGQEWPELVEEFEPYIVRRMGEQLHDWFIRIAEETGHPLQVIVDRWMASLVEGGPAEKLV